LQAAAKLAAQGEIAHLNELLKPFLQDSVERRRKKRHHFEVKEGFTRKVLVLLQRYLHRMPRQVSPGADRRASVVIPLCNYKGVASILFERRSGTVKSYKHHVCFPGGMLDEGVDTTIIQTSLRELEEELGVSLEKTEVLGIMRCNWQEVASMTGISVTPVIGYIGEFCEISFHPNRDEVEDLFTIPLADLLDPKKWILNDGSAPIFTGGK
jgi:nudix motif 8